jgi:hypothetical protein
LTNSFPLRPDSKLSQGLCCYELAFWGMKSPLLPIPEQLLISLGCKKLQFKHGKALKAAMQIFQAKLLE